MLNGPIVETQCRDCQFSNRGQAKGRHPVTRFGRSVVNSSAVLALVLAAGCQIKPGPRPGVSPSVVVGEPLKSEVWRHVATPADVDRINRLGLAWQDALADAKKTNAADVRREGKLLLPRGG